MGKDSLLKPTSKKSAAEKKKTATVQKATGKKKASAPKKSPPKKKTSTPKKAIQTPKAKTVAKNSPAKTTKTAKPKVAAKKQKPPVKKKKMTTKELLLKKYDGSAPDELYRPKTSDRSPRDYTAPPIVTGDDETEVSRIRALLFKKFDLPAPEATGTDPVMEPEADAPPPESPPPAPMEKRSDPMATPIKLALIGFALLVAVVVKVSISNQANYYITPAKTGVEIWQGIFAPIGQERLIHLESAQAPETLQTVYSKKEVYPFVFNHYVKNAEELLGKPGMPDFEGIKASLSKAMPYAATDKHRRLITARLNNIDQMILLIKADVAASKETIADYEAALEYLKQAESLDIDKSKSALIKKKAAAVESSKTELEQIIEKEQKAAEEAAPPAK
jgi:hypothetical protein